MLFLKMKDYRMSHLGEKSRRYEEEIYRKGDYDDAIWQIEKLILKKEAEAFFRRRPYFSYLDFGCGGGSVLEFLEEYASRAVGVDISPDMIAYAKKRVKKAELIVADLTKHDVLAGQRFDMITAFRIFLNAGPELSDEIINVLMPKLGEDGVFIFNFHGNILSYRIFTKLWFMLWGRRLNTISYWSALGFARRYGLSVRRVYGVGIMPKVFYRLISRRLMFKLDYIFAEVPFMKYISYNLILVCERQS